MIFIAQFFPFIFFPESSDFRAKLYYFYGKNSWGFVVCYFFDTIVIIR